MKRGISESMFYNNETIAKIQFRIRERVKTLGIAQWRRIYWSNQGMRIGNKTVVPRLSVTWPHQVQIGNDCILEPNIYFKFDGIWCPGPNIIIGDHTFIGRECEFNIREHISIGKHCLIASGVKFVDHDHGTTPDQLMALQAGPASPIVLEDDVWIGANAVILKGVKLGTGSIVAAGAVVRRSVDAYDVVGGVPAKLLRNRK